MGSKLKIVGTIAVVITLADQWTKWLVVKKMPLGSSMVVFESFFDLVHTQNRGAAFGVLSDWNSAYRDLFFYILSAAAILFLVYFIRGVPAVHKFWLIPIGLITGGAFGNTFDRIFRGAVVDFISLHWNHRTAHFKLFDRSLSFELTWPAFNVADSAITVGVFWILAIMIFFQHRKLNY